MLQPEGNTVSHVYNALRLLPRLIRKKHGFSLHSMIAHSFLSLRASALALLSAVAFAGDSVPVLTLSQPAAEVSRGVQLIDPAAFGFGRPGYMLDTTFMDQQDFANRPGGVDFFEVRTIVPVWTTKVESTRLALSLGYNLTELDLGGLAGMGSETLHTLEAQLSLFWRPTASRWWGLGFVTPGLGTDFQGLSWDDFEVSGLGLLGYRFSDTFSVAGGAFAQYGAEEGRILPALGFIWQPEPFILQVTPPFVVLGWHATERLTLSLSAYPSGGSWDVEGPNVNRVDLSGWQAAASIIYKLTDKLTLSLRGGMNLGGELELRDTNNRTVADETLEAAPFGAVNLRWAF